MKRADKIVVFVAHARDQMARRGVSEFQVRQALHRPDRTARVGGEHGWKRRRFELAISRKHRLAVIVEEESRRLIVVTVWWMT